MQVLKRVSIALAMVVMMGSAFSATEQKAGAPDAALLKSTADHSKFKELQRPFQSGPEVTKACLTCHTEAAKQIHQTQHWKWEYVNPGTGQTLGKRHVINNFCTSVSSNYKSCASCHIGYGLDDKFDFASQENVDCLVCHDATGKYKKPAGFSGHPVTKDTEFPPGSGKIVRGIDLQTIAQKVGKTRRETCGTCHFYGGGGDAVKHGDLDSSLDRPDKALDVHMDAEGNNFTCATCHKTEGHQVPGSRYAPTAMDKGGAHIRGKADSTNPATCQACHGQAPHAGGPVGGLHVSGVHGVARRGLRQHRRRAGHSLVQQFAVRALAPPPAANAASRSIGRWPRRPGSTWRTSWYRGSH